MSLSVTRSPYKSCPYRWILVIQQVSTGAGDVTDSMCESLNGRFKLDYRACLSTGGSLVWSSECLSDGPEPADRIRSRWFLEYHISDERWTLSSLRAIQYPTYELYDSDPCVGDEKVLTRTTASGDDTDGCDVSLETVTITRSCPPEREAREHKRSTRSGQLKRKCGCDCNDEPDDKRYTCSTRNDGGDSGGSEDCCPCHESLEWTVGGFITPAWHIQSGNWPILRNEQHYPAFGQTQCLTDPAGLNDNFGANAWGDHSAAPFLTVSQNPCGLFWVALLTVSCDPVTCMASWSFTYRELRPISTFRLYFWSVIYTASTPLDEYGCGKLPITLTRAPGDIYECDQLIPAYCLPVDGVPDEITLTPSGGCDSPMVIDCGGAGGGLYEEPPFNPDDCLYPEEITTCCDYCDGQDQPCAYIAEFECPVGNPDSVMSGYSVIAARQVTLRQECPFDNTCDWVAVGPSPNPEDGGVGAQPVCATCSGACPETGCTWQSWSAGPCTTDCSSAEYTAKVASRAGKCLRLSWGVKVDARKPDPPGYVAGAVITTLVPTGVNGSGQYVFGPDADGWTVLAHPSVPTPNDCGGCGFMGVQTPSDAEWTAWYVDNWSFVFGRWTTGVGCCASPSPYASDIVDMRPHDTFGVCYVIPILAEWIDCP